MGMEMDFFDLFQLANLASFLAVFASRTLVLWTKQGISPFALGAGKRGLHRFFELALFPGLVLWMLVILASTLHGPFRSIPEAWNPLLLNSLPLKVAGVLLIVFGDIIFVWALLSFGNSWRVGIDEKKAGNLVTGGAFSFSRNPIFVFLDLYFIGTFLINGTLIFLIFALLTLIGLHCQIRQEEKFLSNRYGQTRKLAGIST